MLQERVGPGEPQGALDGVRLEASLGASRLAWPRDEAADHQAYTSPGIMIHPAGIAAA